MNLVKIALVTLLFLIPGWGQAMTKTHFKCAPTKSITRASFDLLMPDSPAAVLVLVPGVNGDGGRFLGERAWTRFAESHKWAIVGVTFVSPDASLKRNAGYYDAASGSGRMLLQTLKRHGLDGKPLYLYGFSGGARFVARFADAYPTHISAFATLGLGEMPGPKHTDGPAGIVACGAEDPRIGASLSWFKDARSKGWRLSWVEAKGVGHVRSATVEEFVRQWFDDESRRSKEGGDGITCEIANGAPSTSASPRSTSAWFPSERTCELWRREFVLKATESTPSMISTQENCAAKRNRKVFSRIMETRVKACPKMTLFGMLPDERPAIGVICLSLIANDVGDIEALLKGDNREGIVSEWLRYAERRNLAVIAWAAPRGLWKARSNWDELSYKENRSVARPFHSVSVSWRNAVENLAREHGLPQDHYLMIGFSGAAQFAMRLALQLPSKFAAVAVHVPSSFDVPVPEGRGLVWCLTTGENESGYERSLRFVEAARRNGYPLIYKAYPGLGHKDSKLACLLGQSVFDYVLEETKRGTADYANWPFVADYVNQRIAKRSQLSGVVEGTSLYLPNEKVAAAWKRE